MSLVNLSENQYVVNLDNIDLHLLSQHLNKSDGSTRPLGSRSHMQGESTYHQVEIVCGPGQIGSSAKYFCHICNKIVPQTYHKQHVTSKIHQNYMKVTQKVLENASKQVCNIDIDESDNNDKSKFFCENCCEVFAVEHKLEHYQSKNHLISLKNENIVDTFLNLYDENKQIYSNYEIEVEENTNGNGTMREYNRLPGSSAFNKSCNNIIPVNNLVLSATKAKDPKNSDVVSSSKRNRNTNKNKELFSEIYNVEIPKVNSAAENAVTLHKNEYDAMLQQVNSLLNRIKLVEDLMTKPSVTTVPSTMQKKKPNEITIEEKIKLYNKQMAEHSETQVECLVCDSKVPNHDANIIDHVEGLRHKKATDELLCKNKMKQVSFKSYQCKLCNITVEDFVDHAIDNVQHIKKQIMSEEVINKEAFKKYVYDKLSINSSLASAYRELHKDLTEQNKIVKLPSGSLYCCVCAVKFAGDIDHMFGKRHIRNYRGTQQSEPTVEEKLDEYNKQLVTISDTTVECLVCDVELPDFEENIIGHIEGKRHTKAVATLLSENKVVQSSYKLYYCDVCNIHFDDFFDHINYDEHIYNIAAS